MVEEEKSDKESLGAIPNLDEDKELDVGENSLDDTEESFSSNKKNKTNSHKKEDKRNNKKIKEISTSVPTMQIALERDIAMDFATKVHAKFEQLIKAIVLFGSSAKKVSTSDSDIDVIMIIDDVSIKWDEETILYYREELGKIIQQNPYRKSLHINTVKLSTWWQDLMRGDPIVINVIRYGDPLIDYGGFFTPLQALLVQGKIKSTPEAVYTLLQRSPNHLARARSALLAVVDGYYWACVDSAHAAIIAADILPSSPEHIPDILKEQFVDKKMLKGKYVDYYATIHSVAKEIIHGKRNEIDGKKLDEFRDMADEFVGEMARLVEELLDKMKEKVN
jgi:predicted nucleotidyltransferase